MYKTIEILTGFIFLMLLLSCSQKEILVIKGEEVQDSIRAYAPDCYIKNRGKIILLREGFVYRNNVLRRYILPHYESILVYNIEKYGTVKEAEPYEELNLKKVGHQEVILFGEKYTILRQNGDTTFLNRNIMLIESSKTID